MLCLPPSFSLPPTDSPSHYLPTLIPFRPTWYRYPTIPGQRDPAQSLAVDTLHKASSERVSQTQIQPGMFLAERVIATSLTTVFRAPPSRRDTRRDIFLCHTSNPCQSRSRLPHIPRRSCAPALSPYTLLIRTSHHAPRRNFGLQAVSCGSYPND